MAKKTAKPEQFEDRVRFNWGFHDGTAEAAAVKAGTGRIRDMRTHFDAAYADGYTRGVETFRITGTRPETSEPAWQARLAERAAAATARKAVRDARPDSRVVRV